MLVHERPDVLSARDFYSQPLCQSFTGFVGRNNEVLINTDSMNLIKSPLLLI